MEIPSEGQYIYRPPLLEGYNYSYWKAKQKEFIVILCMNTWSSVNNSWEPPIDKDRELKPESNWTLIEQVLAQ